MANETDKNPQVSPGPKPGPLSSTGVPGATAHTDTKGSNPLPVDGAGRSLEVGDRVNLTATVTAISGDKLTLGITHPNIEGKASVSVAAGAVLHSGLNPRIGAAPQLRTPVVEVPAKAGGVKPIAKDEFERDENTESTAGLPTATAEHAGRIAAE